MGILGKSVAGGVDYIDLIGAGLVKYFEERALEPYIGNASIKSGVIKLAVGIGSKKFLPNFPMKDSVALGFAIDGVEDLLGAILGGGMLGGGADKGGEGW